MVRNEITLSGFRYNNLIRGNNDQLNSITTSMCWEINKFIVRIFKDKLLKGTRDTIDFFEKKKLNFKFVINVKF